MHLSSFISVMAFLGGVLGAAVPDSVSTSVYGPPTKGPSINALPPPDTPCNATCRCIYGSQPPEGRPYCGFCWGIEPVVGGGLLHGSDVFKCSDGGCCNYGILDGRCVTGEKEKPDLDIFCHGGP